METSTYIVNANAVVHQNGKAFKGGDEIELSPMQAGDVQIAGNVKPKPKPEPAPPVPSEPVHAETEVPHTAHDGHEDQQ